MKAKDLLDMLLENQEFTPVEKFMSAFSSGAFYSFFGLDVNTPLNKEKRTSLHYAAVFGHKQLLKKLLAHPKIKLDVQDINGETPLHYLAKARIEDVDSVLSLVKFGNIDYPDNLGRTPLYYAIAKRKEKIINVLLAHQSSIYIQDKFGNTPIHAAILAKDLNILKQVLSSSTDIKMIKNHKGMTPLDLVIYMNSVEAFKLLLPFQTKADDLYNAAVMAIKQGNLTILEILMNQPELQVFLQNRPDEVKALFEHALQNGQLGILRYLASDASINHKMDNNVLDFINHPNAASIENIFSKLIIHGEIDNEPIPGLKDSFPLLDFKTAALILNSKKNISDNANDVLEVLLNGTKDFEKMLIAINHYINANIDSNLTVRFGILETHWRSGEIRITKDKVEILYIDSLGEKSVGSYMSNDFDAIVRALPQAEVFLSIEKRQRGWTECSFFSVDDLLHLVRAAKFLPEKYADGIFAYVRDHVIKTKKHKLYAEDQSSPEQEKLIGELNVNVVTLPLRFLRTIQSLKSPGSNDNFFFDAGLYPRLAVADIEELNAYVNARKLSMKESIAEHTVSTPAGEINKRLEYKIERMKAHLFDFLMKTPPEEIEKIFKSMSLKSFIDNLAKVNNEKINDLSINSRG